MTWWLWILLALALAVVAFRIIFRGGTRYWEQVSMDGVDEPVLFISRSLFLEVLKRLHIKDTTGMTPGPEVLFDRELEKIPRNFPFHEVAGHRRRYNRVRKRFPQFDHWGLRWVWRVIFLVGYLDRNKRHEAEADLLEKLCYDNARPDLVRFRQAFLAKFAPPQWDKQ